MPHRIDQLVAGYARGDAISQEARALSRVLRELGFVSDIYAPRETIAQDAPDDCRDVASMDAGQADALILHYSAQSPVCDVFRQAKTRRVVRYHNVTPAHFYRGYDDTLANALADARRGLREVVDVADAVWSVSAYNADDIDAGHTTRVEVFPLLFGKDELLEDRHPGWHELEGLTNWLFLGRIAPNKCIEDLILAFAWYHKELNPRSRLIVAGSEYSCPRYYSMLRMLASRLQLPNVCFTGYADGRADLYDIADVFVMPSRHEGYCLPLLEAMTMQVPVVARNTGGMPEAMGDGGIRFDTIEPAELAVLLDRVCREGELRQSVLASQAIRLKEVTARDVRGEVKALIDGLGIG